MYSPTTRLLTMLEILQSYKQMSGAELARRLEVDPRTVRRYIVMLQDMGIPVEGERGPYGAYHLSRGYKLPPLMFTDSEAIALTLALLAVRRLGFPAAVAAVEGALAKIERVMPDKLLLQARALQEAITFNVEPPPFELSDAIVVQLTTAVQAHRQVFVRYQAFGGAETGRVFDPYGVVYYQGYWYTAGYCHLREDLRTFRLDRVLALTTLETAFTPPDDFDSLDHVLTSLQNMGSVEPVEVLIATTLDHARERIPEYMGTLEVVEGGVLFRRGAVQVEWVAYTLMALDVPVTILKGDALRALIRHLGARARQITDASAMS